MLLIMLAAAVSPERPAITDNRIPDAAMIERMERLIIMPKGAQPLDGYDRSYTQAKIDGRDFVVGQLIDRRFDKMLAEQLTRPVPPPVRRVLFGDMAPAFDGGCMIVRLRYDMTSGGRPQLACNPAGPD